MFMSFSHIKLRYHVFLQSCHVSNVQNGYFIHFRFNTMLQKSLSDKTSDKTLDEIYQQLRQHTLSRGSLYDVFQISFSF